jgi:hypothetical protein
MKYVVIYEERMTMMVNTTDERAPTTTVYCVLGYRHQYVHMKHTRIRGNADHSGAAQTIFIMAYGTSKEILGSGRISPALQATYVHILSQHSPITINTCTIS